MRNNILICSANRRVSLVNHFKDQAQRLLGSHAKVLATDLEPDFSAACRVAHKSFATGKFSDSDYIPTLLDICSRNNVGMVVPTIDTELKLLAEHRPLFAKENIALVISDPSFVSTCRNKNATISLFQALGLRVPKHVDLQNPQFPLFAKPVDGSSSKDIYIVTKKEQLSPYIADCSRFIHQEYLQPSLFDEYSVDLYYDRNSRLKCAVPRRRIAVRGGEINKGLTVRNHVFEAVNAKLKTLDGARGCITLQVFLEKETSEVVGIEINPRFGGGYPLSYLAGANYPAMLIQEYLFDRELQFFDEWEEGLLLLRYDNEMIIHASER